MIITVTVGVAALFDSIWNNTAMRPESIPGKREDYDEAESAIVYHSMLRERILDEFPTATLHVALVRNPVVAAILRGDHSVTIEPSQGEIDGDEYDVAEVQSIVEEIEDDTWAAFGDGCGTGSWLVKKIVWHSNNKEVVE